MSILNNGYYLQFRMRTPEVFRTPGKHLHLPTIAINLGFLNPNNNYLEFRKALLSLLYCPRCFITRLSTALIRLFVTTARTLSVLTACLKTFQLSWG
jgi:hypothetical protein